MAQSAGAVEYTDCISAGGKTQPTSGLDINTKQYDDEASKILELLGNVHSGLEW